MGNPSLLIVGCGDLGERVGTRLSAAGWQICAVRRHPDSSMASFSWHAADYSRPGSLDFAGSLCPDFVLATFTPRGFDPSGYQRGFTRAAINLLHGLGEHRAQRLIIVSSTRVYAESRGGWVDETAATATRDERSLAIIDAERQFLTSSQPATAVRFGGIYGDPSGRLLARIARGQIAPEKPLRYTNRIHRDDCAGFLAHLLLAAQAGSRLHPIYNGVDNEPAPAHEVEMWLANAMGVEPNEQYLPQIAAPDHKRCCNRRLRASGYDLLYPDYRAGYRQVLGIG